MLFFSLGLLLLALWTLYAWKAERIQEMFMCLKELIRSKFGK